VTPLTLSSPTKATPFWIILWRCWASSDHGIARLGTYDLHIREYWGCTLHRLRPVIDRTFGFVEAKAAYRYFEGRGHFGSVVITHG
jgi:hypothetical protein